MNTLLVLLLLAVSCPAATVLRVACGGPGGTDLQGNVWQPDIFYTGGAAWTVTPATALDIPYRNLRYGTSFAYTLLLPPGQYNVTLKFIEPNKTAAGQRVFHVLINGVAVVQNLDLVAAYGLLTPHDYTFPVTATSGQIQIGFVGKTGNAIISGIQVDAPDPPPPPMVVSFCEVGWLADGGLEGSAVLAPGAWANHGCENVSASPYRILRARCRSNVAGPTFDVLAPDAANVYQSVLAAPIACTPQGNNVPATANASYADGQALKFRFVIPAGVVNVREARAVVLMQETPTAAKLGTLKVCSGAGCDGLWHANIIRADGAALSLYGVDMVPTNERPGIVWLDK